MDIKKYFTFNKLILLILVLMGGALYKRYKNKYMPDEELKNQHIVNKYLLTDSDTIDKKKPMLWIHTTHEVNSRQWADFMTRNSKQVNQNYLELCVKSIIKFNQSDFNICLIDDNSFEKIIPGWSVNMNKLADPLKSHMRSLALLKLLQHYGGLLCPNSMIALKGFRRLYGNSLSNNGLFVGEFVSNNDTSQLTDFYPCMKFMGAEKENKHLGDLIRYCEQLVSGDCTNEMDFSGKLSRKMYEMFTKNKLHIVNGRCLGVKDKENKPVLVDHLISDTYIEYDKDLVAVYLPSKDILKRNKYNWFVRLNKSQLRDANTMASKFLLMSEKSQIQYDDTKMV